MCRVWVRGWPKMVKRVDVAKTIRKIGVHEAHFQFRQVREDLKVGAKQKNEANRTWNILAEFIAEGTVEQKSDERKRHKYYMLKNPAKLQEILRNHEQLTSSFQSPTNEIARLVGAGPERLVRIEGDIRAIRQDQVTIRENQATIREELASLNAKFLELVQAWS